MSCYLTNYTHKNIAIPLRKRRKVARSLKSSQPYTNKISALRCTGKGSLICNTKEYASCVYCVGKAGTDVYTIYHLPRRSEEVLQHGSYTPASIIWCRTFWRIHYLQKISDVKISDVLFWTFNSRTLFPLFRTIFGQKFWTLHWNMPKVNLWLKKHELYWNKICENDSFTEPSRFYSQIHHKRNKYFSFPVITRMTEQNHLIRILAISCLLALNMWCCHPESTFKVLYYTVKISDA